ncbi:hypothetical protein EDB86DRAFT_2833284 [Lactarius hatsudake]|nr:hypothetical protein EDB86DRAFT_2833284 [Lactarius hatsudake]
MRCDELIEATAAALNDDMVALMLLAVQRDNIELSVKTALNRGEVSDDDNKHCSVHSRPGMEAKEIVRECLVPFPYIWFFVSGCRSLLLFKPADDAYPWLSSFLMTMPLLGSPEMLTTAVLAPQSLSSALQLDLSDGEVSTGSYLGSPSFEPTDGDFPLLSSILLTTSVLDSPGTSERLSWLAGFEPTDDSHPRLSRYLLTIPALGSPGIREWMPWLAAFRAY